MPRGAGCDERTGAALLKHEQLQTLYHEMGHAIHALVARTGASTLPARARTARTDGKAAVAANSGITLPVSWT